MTRRQSRLCSGAAGDRIVVTEDTTNFMDDFMERTFRPLGITPPKKKDPLKDRYEIRG